MIKQIVKFVGVGVIDTLIDFTIYTVLTLLGVHYLIAGFCGFAVAVVISYFLSFKFVFVRREDFSQTKSFILFVVLSLGGLLLNELGLFICMDCIYKNSSALQSMISAKLAKLGAKCLTTGFVMIYNFTTRKLILEKREDKNGTTEQQ